MTWTKCEECHHIQSVHRISESEKCEDSKLYRTSIRCTAKWDNGDDCDCFIEWLSYSAVVKYGGTK